MWVLSTAAALALLFGYHTSRSGPNDGRRSSSALAPVGVVTAAPMPPAAAAAPSSGRAAAPRRAAPVLHLVNGAAIQTRYGPVQVQIKVRSGRIVAADAITFPDRARRSEEINRRAVPQLDDETLQNQSARIDTVSGASFTSAGYRASLQSALDAAHL